MTIVVNPASRAKEWMAALTEQLPNESLFLWPQVGDPARVEYVLAWQMAADDLAGFPNLAAVFSLGAGVDQWLPLAEDERLADVTIVRLVDPAVSDEMAAYALHWVLHYQRRFDQMAALQQQRQFTQPDYVEAADFAVGILGYGNIGRRVGEAFTTLGYPINAWSRTLHHDQPDPSIDHYAGLEELNDFLSASQAVVNVLPNTAETTGLLSPDRLDAFADGAVFVNMGRGTVVREADLLAALDNGPLRVAVLDVTEPEPPPPSSPLFDHPNVVLTGHTAGVTLIPSASRIIAANIKRLRRGEEPYPVVDAGRGY
ncbi:MAG: glyoxylate/hydroxypyruvate reductase A [Acidimicrobiia bacterium]|nr:glyoxylate/hydroxypyruvate reductase A [Acidimicrobiia bacterium]